MSTPDPAVFRIINYGGYYRASVQGGSAVEYYGVVGLAAAERATAHSLSPGLPAIGSPHVDSRWGITGYNIGTVQDVDCVQEFGPLGWVARVRYSVGGTFNFSTRIGSKDSGAIEWTRLPIMGGLAGHRYSVLPEVLWPRAHWSRTESVRLSAADIDTVCRLVKTNIGRFYAKRSEAWISDFGGVRDADMYRLTGADIRVDAGNNARVDTFFACTMALPAFPASTFAGQTLDIPALPTDCIYSEDSASETIVAFDPFSFLPAGERLPWLP